LPFPLLPDGLGHKNEESNLRTLNDNGVGLLTGRWTGDRTMRWSLIQECVIGISKLAYDDGPQNPAAVKLAETVLTLPRGVANDFWELKKGVATSEREQRA
jgi:hypothetical protein